jgi:hypothetical protein
MPSLSHQTVPVENGMHRAFGRDAHIADQKRHEKFADLAGSPVRLFLLEPDDHRFDRLSQLVGMAPRPPRSIRQCLQPVTLQRLKIL